MLRCGLSGPQVSTSKSHYSKYSACVPAMAQARHAMLAAWRFFWASYRVASRSDCLQGNASSPSGKPGTHFAPCSDRRSPTAVVSCKGRSEERRVGKEVEI